MKMKGWFFAFLFTVLGWAANAKDGDTIPSTIHHVLIFKWCKEGDNNIKRYIKIDSLGNVIIKNQQVLEKVEMQSFTKSIRAFIKKEKTEKIAGSDNAKYADVPAADRQNIFISVLLTEDYAKEKKLKNPSYYLWQQINIDKFVNDYPLFNYLPKAQVTMLKRYLE
jgi:hypothetical protein